MWPLLVLIVIVAGLVWAARLSSVNVRFGLAWFALTLLPALAIRYLLADDYVHDRYLYLPSVGLAIILAVWFSKVRFTPPRIALACVVAVALCWATRSDLRIWQDNTTLFQRAVETSPHNAEAMNNLANAYLATHHEAEAFPLLQQVIAMRPDALQGYFNMAHYYHQIGNRQEEARYFAMFQQIYYAQQQRALR